MKQSLPRPVDEETREQVVNTISIVPSRSVLLHQIKCMRGWSKEIDQYQRTKLIELQMEERLLETKKTHPPCCSPRFDMMFLLCHHHTSRKGLGRFEFWQHRKRRNKTPARQSPLRSTTALLCGFDNVHWAPWKLGVSLGEYLVQVWHGGKMHTSRITETLDGTRSKHSAKLAEETWNHS